MGKKMGRPVIGDAVLPAITVQSDLKQNLSMLAVELGLSVSECRRRAYRFFIAGQKHSQLWKEEVESVLPGKQFKKESKVPPVQLSKERSIVITQTKSLVVQKSTPENVSERILMVSEVLQNMSDIIKKECGALLSEGSKKISDIENNLEPPKVEEFKLKDTVE